MNELRDVLAYGYPVWHHDEFDCLITWNGHATFLWWNLTDKGWENTDVHTSYDIQSLTAAENEAAEWAEEAAL